MLDISELAGLAFDARGLADRVETHPLTGGALPGRLHDQCEQAFEDLRSAMEKLQEVLYQRERGRPIRGIAYWGDLPAAHPGSFELRTQEPNAQRMLVAESEMEGIGATFTEKPTSEQVRTFREEHSPGTPSARGTALTACTRKPRGSRSTRTPGGRCRASRGSNAA